MILAARRPAYRPPALKRLLERDRALFEHWTHDASILPVALFPVWQLRFARDADRLLRFGAVDESLRAALATGCTRVNIGTAALENPQWCARAIAEYGDRVAVGLDVQVVDGEHRLRGRGWETDGGDLWLVLERLDSEGCSRFVVTDVTKDGTLTGPNLDLLEGVAECTNSPVIASGGVSSLDDLRAIATLTGSGIEGAIVGKALYAGRFTLPEALAAVNR
jgi:phosphoribosylanthranilate isomerase